MTNSKFISGDEIRFLNETGSGKIVKQLEKGLYLVRADDGFEYPVHEKELVLIKRNQIIEDSNDKAAPSERKEIEENKTENIFDDIELKENDETIISLAWIPSDGGEFFDGKLDLYLINDSNYFMLFHILKMDEFGLSYINAGVLEPNLKIEVGHFNRDDLNSLKYVQAQIILYGHKKNIYNPAIDEKFVLKPVKFFNSGNYVENDFFDVPAFFMYFNSDKAGKQEIIEETEELDMAIAEKDWNIDEDKSARFKARPKPETNEVDLHINVLKENIVGMSNAEILDFQMQHFHKTLTAAIENKTSKIVFIHGIGNGTLRDTLRDSLDKQYKLKYQDASFREYGFGATLVYVS
jgi:hypothetical protein